MTKGSHRRLDPLTGRWILLSNGNPAQPRLVTRKNDDTGESCALCSEAPPSVVTHPASPLLPDSGKRITTDALMVSEGTEGTVQLLVYSGRHDHSLPGMDQTQLGEVIDLWKRESKKLGDEHRWVQLIDGVALGGHPSAEVWAGSLLPVEAAAEDDKQDRHFAEHQRTLLEDYVAQEVGGERVVYENGHWLIVVPYWARIPFETLIIPKRSVARLPDIDSYQQSDLAEALEQLFDRFNRLAGGGISYAMGWHGAPFNSPHEHWTLHAHVYPDTATPRSGYDLLAEPHLTITPETAAQQLRESS